MARALELVSEETVREVESLRGRAVFYTTKLLMSLHGDPEGEGGARRR